MRPIVASSTARTVALVLILLMALAAGVIAVRTFLATNAPSVTPLSYQVPAVDLTPAANHLGEAIRFQTIGLDDQPMASASALEALRAWLVTTYPRFHATVTLTTVGGGTLVYEWSGTDDALQPVILMAHQDVVPALDSDPWTHPPYSGVLADGAVWGRGSIDNKASLVAIMEAAESLLAAGHTPERSLIFVFGHDEETTGSGAAAAAALLQDRGIRAEFVLDEGSLMVSDYPVTRSPVGLIGISEKGFATVTLTATAPGGHSSAPPARTAVDILAEAIIAVTGAPFPRRYEGPTRMMLEALAPNAPLLTRMAIANAWLFKPILVAQLAATPQGAAMLQTTIAPTMLQGSPKANVLASSATAMINLRIATGETVAGTLAHVRESVAPLGVTAELTGTSQEPAPVSSAASSGYRLVASVAASVFDMPIVPAPVIAATDSRSMSLITDAIYRFQPVVLSLEETGMLHGANEHIEIEEFGRMIGFFQSLMLASSERTLP
jgi:carboxypeptidase PM20D1